MSMIHRLVLMLFFLCKCTYVCVRGYDIVFCVRVHFNVCVHVYNGVRMQCTLLCACTYGHCLELYICTLYLVCQL